MIHKQCTLLSDSLAKAIERVCRQKDNKAVVINDDGQIYDPTNIRRKIKGKEITMKKDNKCSICSKEIDVQVFEGGGTWAGGHNAEPINDGTCCTKCNDTIVTPTRIRQHMKGDE